MTGGTLTTLRRIAHLRSGDKGDTACISVIAYDDALYPLLLEQVTARRVAERYGAAVKGMITRYEIPAICALNFTLDRALGGGVSRNLAIDVYGKALCGALLDLPMLVPEDLTSCLVGNDDVAKALCGTWKLVAYRRTSGEEVVYPFGQDARGWLQYGADGRVSATLCRADRSPMTGPVADDWSGDEKEWADAGSSYLSYTGTWSIEEDRVRHRVDACSYPNWTGVELVRRFRFEGCAADPTLTLVTGSGEISSAALMSSELVWRRAV